MHQVLAATTAALLLALPQTALAQRSPFLPDPIYDALVNEVLNVVDGRRSYAEIYTAVAAEADRAGTWYYGEVSLEDVVSYLDSAERAGIISVATRALAPVTGGEGRK